MKMYYIGLLGSAALMTAGPVSAGSVSVSGNGCAATPSWITVLGTLISDPVKWAMYVTAVTSIIFVIVAGLKFRGARGRQDKVEDAQKFSMYFVGGSVLIFGATGLTTWFLGKFGCTVNFT